MIIHGVELDFHMLDEDKADMKKRYFGELNKMKGISTEIPGGTPRERNAFLCERIKGLFDSVFGEGTGVAVCGPGNDLLNHLDAYDQLVTEQIRQQDEYNRIMEHLKTIQVVGK